MYIRTQRALAVGVSVNSGGGHMDDGFKFSKREDGLYDAEICEDGKVRKTIFKFPEFVEVEIGKDGALYEK